MTTNGIIQAPQGGHMLSVPTRSGGIIPTVSKKALPTLQINALLNQDDGLNSYPTSKL